MGRSWKPFNESTIKFKKSSFGNSPYNLNLKKMYLSEEQRQAKLKGAEDQLRRERIK